MALTHRAGDAIGLLAAAVGLLAALRADLLVRGAERIVRIDMNGPERKKTEETEDSQPNEQNTCHASHNLPPFTAVTWQTISTSVPPSRKPVRHFWLA
jgi:hypothetical protein